MKNLKKREIIFILVLSFIVVVAWITFSIHHNFVTSTIPDALTVRIAPIEKNFNTATIESLMSRKSVSPFSQGNLFATASASPPPQSTQGGTLSP